MKNVMVKFSVLFSGLMVSGLAFAEGGEAASTSGLVAIGAAIAVALATFGAASAQGRTASSALEGICRNPGASDKVFMPFILGMVFMEFQALLGFVIAILWTLK